MVAEILGALVGEDGDAHDLGDRPLLAHLRKRLESVDVGDVVAGVESPP